MSDSDKLLLLGFTSHPYHLHFCRELTADEIEAHQQHRMVVAEARNRLKLFGILEHNYRDWRQFIDAKLNPLTKDSNDMDSLDRLLLNYLTCAYTIREHFKVSFRQRFRKDAAKENEYDQFVENLCQHHWAFGFFLDFRGYVQHKGLPVGAYSRKVDLSCVTVSVPQDAESLLSESREWPMSKSTKQHGKLDLVKLLQEFHVVMMKGYVGFVIVTLFPELHPAQQFYASLSDEVKRVNPDFTMVFRKDQPVALAASDRITTTLEIELPDNDVFAELGDTNISQRSGPTSRALSPPIAVS